MKQLRPIQLAAFVLVVAAYIAVRFWHLTDSCLWFDEIFSVHAAEHSWDTILSFVALDLIHPPLFYVLLKLWIAAGGESLFWLRLFPVMFAVVSLVPFILFLRELKQNRWVEILALFLLAVNGSLIKYAQEVRMYSFLMCLALFSMWLFTQYFVKGKSFLPLVVVNLLLVYTHYFGWFVILAEIAAVLIFQRIKLRRILIMFAIEFVSFIPWIFAVWNAAHSGSELGQNIGWMTRPCPRDAITFILNLVEPFYYQASNSDPVSIFKVSLPILLIAVIAICFYFANWKKQSDWDRQNIKLVVLFVVLPLIFAFVLSWLLPYSIWGTRHLIIVLAQFSIFLAISLCKISNATVRTATLTLIILFSGYTFVLESFSTRLQYSWCAWEPLAVEVFAKNDANIYTFEDLIAYHVWFDGRNQRTNNQVFKTTGIDGIAEDKAYFLPRGFNDVGTINFDEIGDTKLWIAYRSKTIEPNEPPLRNFIVKGYHVINQLVIEAKGESAILILLEK